MPGGDSRSARPIVFGVSAVLLALLLWALRNLVMLVGYSVLLAYALDPIVTALELRRLPRPRRIPRGVASAIVMLGLVLVAGWVLAFAAPRLAAETGRFVGRAPATVERLLLDARSYAEEHHLGGYVDSAIEGARANAPMLLQKVGGAIAAWIGRIFGGLGQLLSLALLPLLAF